MNNNAR